MSRCTPRRATPVAIKNGSDCQQKRPSALFRTTKCSAVVGRPALPHLSVPIGSDVPSTPRFHSRPTVFPRAKMPCERRETIGHPQGIDRSSLLPANGTPHSSPTTESNTPSHDETRPAFSRPDLFRSGLRSRGSKHRALPSARGPSLSSSAFARLPKECPTGLSGRLRP